MVKLQTPDMHATFIHLPLAIGLVFKVLRINSISCKGVTFNQIVNS